MRPECGLELEPVRIPHTVRVLPYNYCNENEYQLSLIHISHLQRGDGHCLTKGRGSQLHFAQLVDLL